MIFFQAPWLSRVSELLKIYVPKESTVTLRRINLGTANNNYRPILGRVKLSGETRIVIDCSIETLPEMLKQVSFNF